MSGALRGLRVVVTRRPEQSTELSQRLRAAGAEVVELAAIAVAPPEDVAPLDACLRRLADYAWLVFTSANAVEAVHARRIKLGLAEPEGWPRLASVGAATTRALTAAFGRAPELEPESDLSAEGLLSAFEPHAVSGARVLLPLSDRARDVLASGLAQRGARVDTPVAYRTIAPRDLAERYAACARAGFDILILASPSAVAHLVAVAAAGLAGRRAAVIGPVTARAARAAGLDVIAVAEPSTAAGLVASLLRALDSS